MLQVETATNLAMQEMQEKTSARATHDLDLYQEYIKEVTEQPKVDKSDNKKCKLDPLQAKGCSSATPTVSFIVLK